MLSKWRCHLHKMRWVSRNEDQDNQIDGCVCRDSGNRQNPRGYWPTPDLARSTESENGKTTDGFNIGVNAGASAGQTVFHVHCHLIPRRTGDMGNPVGGVRGVILAKQGY